MRSKLPQLTRKRLLLRTARCISRRASDTSREPQRAKAFPFTKPESLSYTAKDHTKEGTYTMKIVVIRSPRALRYILAKIFNVTLDKKEKPHES